MRSSSDESGSEAALIVVAVWLIVIGAWIALAGRFTVALLAMGTLAAFVSVGALRYVTRHHV